MANKVLLKKSSVAAKVPVAADLDYGEIALNYQDGKIYYKKADNSIDSFVSGSAVTGVSSVAGNTGVVTANQLLTAINTVDGSGSGLDADLLDGRDSLYFAPDSHKYHSFTNNTYYYDSYSQYRFFRLFTENFYSDTLRYCPVSSVEYFNYTNTTWEDWTSGGLGGVKNLLDGQDGTYMDVDHAHRKFRFVITKSTGWPTDVLIAMYMSWWGNAWTNIVLTVEDAATTAGPWTVKETLTFNSTNTNADYGWHAYYSGNLHNGRTATRITVDIPDWVDQPGYTTKRINTISMFSNYTGDKLQPWTWNYDKNVTFYNTPYVNANQVWHAGNDGAGSGLDADLLDGYNIGTTGNAIPLLSGANTWSGNQIFTFQSLTVSNAAPILRLDDSDNGANIRYWEIIANGTLRFRTVDDAGAQQSAWLTATRAANGTVGVDLTTTSLTANTNTIWHAGNDGASSGLDADLLDGQQGSYYLDTSATAQTKTGNLTITGDLIVNGTTTTINSTTLTVDDKNIELGSIASPTDTTADGGGITLKGATDKTFNWVQSTGYWTANNSISAPRFVSTQATGTSPFIVASTTLVTNLNADLLDGLNSATTNTASTIVARDASGNFAAGTITATLTGSATSLASLGSVTAETLTADAPAGLSFRQAYSNGYPTTYGNVISLGGAGHNQIFFGWSGTSGASADNYIRSQRDTGDANWSAWAKIWTDVNDGTGSGLDADLLDGLNSSSFLRNDVLNQEVLSYLTINTDNGFAVLEFEDASNVTRAHVYHATASNYLGIGVFDAAGTNRKDLVLNQNGTITWNNNTVWHAGNDGTGSGLDADLLGGVATSSYVTLTGTQTLTNKTLTAPVINGSVNFDSNTLFVDSVNDRIGILTGTPSTRLQVGVKVSDDNTYTYDANSLYVVHQTATGTAVLNDPKEVLLLARQGSSGGAYGAAASFRLSRYENSGVNSRTRLDLVLAHDSFLGSPATVLTARSDGNVGIGTTAPVYKLEVNGSFAATTKSFVIDHPTKSDMKLRYGSLEGPENGVYVRGRLKNNKIELPDYWTKLVDPASITVSLTSVGKHQDLYVKSIENNTITVANSNLVAKGIDCFYVVYGERCDVDKLQVEIAK